MSDQDKTRTELLAELKILRSQVASFQDESTFHEILSAVDAAVLITDDKDHIRFLCSRCPAIFGLTASDFQQMESIQDLLGEDLFNPETLDSQNEIRNIHKRIQKKNEGWQDFEITVKKVNMFGGSRMYVCKDVTNQKQEETKYSKIVETANDGYWMIDSNGIIIDANQAAAEMLEYERDELVGMHIRDIDALDQDKEIKKNIKVAMDQGIQRFESVHKTKSGKLLDIELVGSHLPSKDGDFVVVFIRDVSQSKEAQDMLEKQLEALKQSELVAHLGYFERNWQTGQGYWSEGFSKLMGLEPGVVLSHPDFTKYLHPKDKERVVQHIQESLETKTPMKVEFRIVQKGGRVLNINGIADNTYGADGKPLLTRGVFQDVTESKRLERLLLQAQKMESIGRLAGGVAHDFNNLLTAIRGFSELVYQALNGQKQLQQDVGEIIKAADTAAALTAQLLTFSRRQIVSPKVLNLNHATEQSKNMLQRLIGEDVELEFNMGAAEPNVLIDPNQVNQILVNLAANARDAMPHGGRLVFETKNVFIDDELCESCMVPISGHFVLLSVSDNGKGMSKKELDNIFEPFFTTKENGHGTGLGLATVHGIVRQNNGHVHVYSESGIGTVFKIYIPMIRQKAKKTDSLQQTAQLHGREKVLLVEDLDIVRRLASRTLTNYGYTVFEAKNGQDALDRFKDKIDEIDLLLTDVVMPILGGKKLYDQLVEKKPGLKVLFISGYSEDTIAHHGVVEKGLNFIQKPFRSTELISKIRDVLDSSKELVDN